MRAISINVRWVFISSEISKKITREMEQDGQTRKQYTEGAERDGFHFTLLFLS